MASSSRFWSPSAVPCRRTAKRPAAISRGAGPEEIAACATAEGLHSLAGALFEACEEGGASNAALDPSDLVEGALAARLKEFRQQLPAGCETAKLIDSGARLEEISEAAQKEGLTSSGDDAVRGRAGAGFFLMVLHHIRSS